MHTLSLLIDAVTILVNVKHKKSSGFTIIEVLIVIAIAGLIFLIVFVAVPHAHKQLRNAQRKRDVQRFFTALLDFKSYNDRKIPGGHLTSIGARSKFLKPIVENRVLPITTNDVDSKKVDACNAASPRADYDSTAPGFDDPLLGRCYFVSYGESIGDLGKIDWLVGYKCLGESWLPLTSSKTGKESDVAAVITLEGGATFCVDNAL